MRVAAVTLVMGLFVSTLSGGEATITINGKTIRASGKSITVNNDTVMIDGKVVSGCTFDCDQPAFRLSAPDFILRLLSDVPEKGTYSYYTVTPFHGTQRWCFGRRAGDSAPSAPSDDSACHRNGLAGNPILAETPSNNRMESPPRGGPVASLRLG